MTREQMLTDLEQAARTGDEGAARDRFEALAVAFPLTALELLARAALAVEGSSASAAGRFMKPRTVQ